MTASVVRWVSGDSPPLDRTGEATATWAAGMLADAFGAKAIRGLYVATSDAGVSESVDFWRSALDRGLPFASPQAFPWTLANSPTGRIADRLAVRGPTYTLVGGGAALAGAAGHALRDVARGNGPALLVALDGMAPDRAAVTAVEVVAVGAGPRRLTGAVVGAWTDETSATAALRGLIAATA